MIVEYHRPHSIEEAINLVEKSEIESVLMGGGTAIDRFRMEPFAVIDLQDAGMDVIRVRGNSLDIGACVTLHALAQQPDIQPHLTKSILHQAASNIRQVASVAGTIVSAGGRSPFALAMLALDASLVIEPGEEQQALGDFMALKRTTLKSRLITKITMPLNVRLVYEYVARTPADMPIVSAAVARWPSGRTRVVLGGCGEAPMLAMDGPSGGGESTAAVNAYSLAEDQWASAEYRQEMAGKLVSRCISKLAALDEG
jgi:CO/xanthine dehydrogenase FAD-binding subunit